MMAERVQSTRVQSGGPAADTGPESRTPETELAITRVATAWRDLRRNASMQAVRRQLNTTSAGVLDLGQVDTLHLLAEAGELRMAELAERLRVDASTATRAAQRLVDAGFAVRRADPDDRRGVVVVITETGRETQAEIVARARRLLDWLAAGFSGPELAQLGELMTRFVARIDASVCLDLEGDLDPDAEPELAGGEPG
ncbi:MAG: MarR family winged helix-turn-helix transcriptional regulator [Acidimicrobiia bacterium]